MSIRDLIMAEAARQGVDPDLALRVAHQESGFNQSAVSPKGARGVMQLMPATARGLGVNPDDTGDNIRGGVTYLKQQLDRFKDPRLALAAYNAGPGAVQRAGGVPNFRETQGYVGAIMGGQPQSGADIFGMGGDSPSAASQGASGADIFADAPKAQPTPQPPPVAAPAPPPGPKQTSQMLGVLEGILPAAQKLAPYSPLNVVPGFKDRVAHDLTSLQSRIAQREQTETPGKTGEFVGNVATTGWIPGGPMLNGAATGALLSKKTDAMGIMGDMAAGAAGGKLGSAVVGGAGKLVRGLTGDALHLAQKGVPLTPGQMMGGFAKNLEDKATSIPIVGDVIRNAQRRGMEGANRAAFNDTLGKVGETLPDHVQTGSDAYTYTKQRLGDLYDEVLAPLNVTKDTPFSQAMTAAKAKIAKIGDPTARANALNILKTSVNSRIDKSGKIVGNDLKDIQSDLGSHVNDLMQGKTWERKAGAALKDLKTAVEELVSRTDATAGEKLAQVNAGWAHLKPLETATAKAATKDGGIFNMNQLVQGVAKGKGAAAVAGGNVPHQALAGAAARVLPSSVPDSGTAGRLALPAAGAMLFGGHLPVIGPAAVPAAGLIGGMSALYTRGGQKLLTGLMSSRSPQVRMVGEQLRRLAAPAGTATAVTLAGARN